MDETNQETSFAGVLVAANADLWAAMAGHPWVRALADGSMPDAALIAWAQQCRLFCIQEGRALMVLRSYDPAPELDQILAHLEDDTVREPKELAETITSLGAPVVDEAWPICLGYSSYIMASVRSGLLEGLTAIYACERAYLDTWTAVLPSVPPESRWHDWVENWTEDLFRQTVTGLGRCLDELAGTPSAEMQARLHIVFRNVARYEHAFWEMNWRQQGWPELGDSHE
jgi:thiaminase